jgi:hypothetical protein
VKRELEGRDHLAALSNRGFVVGGAPFEITAYEVDDDGGGGLAFLYGQWDESGAALRIGRRAEEIDRAHLLRTLGQWETVKGNALVYPPDADDEPAILDLP